MLHLGLAGACAQTAVMLFVILKAHGNVLGSLWLPGGKHTSHDTVQPYLNENLSCPQSYSPNSYSPPKVQAAAKDQNRK